ncbi:hypothetical protein [Frankia sp. CiP3]|uniref:hypothetical protein n=1 Tax=Frankia sp. CiP3 TaxID=2880971 RepID=UPI001EF48FB6|nr:hypothetical protein [Frankia sp. CiP3]
MGTIPGTLPYPHAHHDCAACGERDADLVLDDSTTLCERCAAWRLAHALAAIPVGADGWVVTLRIAPGRLLGPAA